ncbi:MAG: hypothetical protein ACI4M6_05675 [Christensenellaceae bacterium]
MYKKIEKFILEKLKKYKLDPHSFVASDLAYDLKSDFCDSDFNPISKTEECWEQAQDDWYDDFVFAEVVPVVAYLGATIETEDESDAIDVWLERYCSILDEESEVYVSNEDQGEPECFMLYGGEFHKVINTWEPKEYVFRNLCKERKS